MLFAYETHVVKVNGKYQLRVFKDGHIIKEGEYESYAGAMIDLNRFQKEQERAKRMTLQDLIDGVRYEIQGNVVIKVQTEDSLETVYESINGSGINETDVLDYVDHEVNFIYATERNLKPALFIELGSELED